MNGRDSSSSTGKPASMLQQRYMIVMPVTVLAMPRIELQTAAVACALIGMITFGPGFLQNMRMAPSLPWAMLPLMIGAIRFLLARHCR